MRPVDLIVGKIEDMHHEMCAGWKAFRKKDDENDELRLEIERLKKLLRRKSGRKIAR